MIYPETYENFNILDLQQALKMQMLYEKVQRKSKKESNELYIPDLLENTCENNLINNIQNQKQKDRYQMIVNSISKFQQLSLNVHVEEKMIVIKQTKYNQKLLYISRFYQQIIFPIFFKKQQSFKEMAFIVKDFSDFKLYLNFELDNILLGSLKEKKSQLYKIVNGRYQIEPYVLNLQNFHINQYQMVYQNSKNSFCLEKWAIHFEKLERNFRIVQVYNREKQRVIQITQDLLNRNQFKIEVKKNCSILQALLFMMVILQ